MTNRNRDTYGLWRVTTEGDVEGRSTRQLGIHEGYLEDIAFSLAAQACYVLTFELINAEVKLPLPTRTEVSVQLYEPGGGVSAYATNKLMNMMVAANVKHERSNFYESVRIYNGQTKEELARNTALEKLGKAGLTAAELKAIGLK